MNQENTTFDQVFKIWLDNEVLPVENRDLLPVAKQKGFSSISEWRLTIALRLELDKKQWMLEEVSNPQDILPNIIIGPYQGWSIFFENRLDTTFEQALQIPEFFEWCKTHDRVIPLSENFPLPTTIICLRRNDGSLIHIEGGHRMCAVAYANKIGRSINFSASELDTKVNMAVASATDEDIERMLKFLKEGTFKQ